MMMMMIVPAFLSWNKQLNSLCFIA